MAAVWIAAALLLCVLFLRERARNKSLCREIAYIQQQIGSARYTAENRYILLPSEDREIKELAAELNRMLDSFYLQKADYERTKRAMTQVLANLSHDLRTPLTVLKGYSELLGREIKAVPAPAETREMAAKIDRKADELVKTINEYFTLSKIESGDMAVRLQRTNITALCHEVILDYSAILEKERFEVEAQIVPEPVFAYVDGEAFQRILKNLVDNAVRHGGAGKYLGVRLRSVPGRAEVEVEDRGPGIAPAEQEKIFFRNYTTAHDRAGSGLGLTIAKNLALQMEADIRVASEPGKRTVFTLVLKR